MFYHITQSWWEKPLISYGVIVHLIAATTTRAGLTTRSDIDKAENATGIKVTDGQVHTISIRRTGFHGEWNYTFTSCH